MLRSMIANSSWPGVSFGCVHIANFSFGGMTERPVTSHMWKPCFARCVERAGTSSTYHAIALRMPDLADALARPMSGVLVFYGVADEVGA